MAVKDKLLNSAPAQAKPRKAEAEMVLTSNVCSVVIYWSSNLLHSVSRPVGVRPGLGSGSGLDPGSVQLNLEHQH